MTRKSLWRSARPSGCCESRINSIDQEFVRLHVVGHGAFGDVCLARRKTDNRLFAIKTISSSADVAYGCNEHLLHERETLEKCAATSLSSFIVGIAGWCSETSLSIVLEWVPGGSLAQIFLDNGGDGLNSEACQFYVANAAFAVAAAHSANVVHRDISPENFLVAQNGYLKLAGFGLACVLAPGDRTYTVCGTPEYMAPEVIKCEGHGLGADWWSLGVLAYELVTGETPFQAQDLACLYRLILEGCVYFGRQFGKIRKNFVKSLLRQKLQYRAGHSAKGAQDVFDHPWLVDMGLEKILKHLLRAPAVARVKASQEDAKPAGSPAQSLKVKIVSARGLLRQPPWILSLEDLVQAKDVYAQCFIGNSTDASLTTPCVENHLNPVWDCEANASGIVEGDNLFFEVFQACKDGSSRSLGTATLKADDYEKHGFHGHLRLSNTVGGAAAYIEVGVATPHSCYPVAGATGSNFVVALLEGRTGIRTELIFDNIIGYVCRVVAVTEGSVAHKFNLAAPKRFRIQPGYYVQGVNGIGNADSIDQALKSTERKEVELVPYKDILLRLRPIDRRLSIDVKNSDTGAELVCTKCAISGQVLPGDFICSVGGMVEASAMLKHLSKAESLDDITVHIRRISFPPSFGPVNVSSIARVAHDDCGLLPQPAEPRARTMLVQVFTRNCVFGGLDKSGNGHRYDSVSFANGLIRSGISCQLVHYIHEEHAEFVKLCGEFDAIILRFAPDYVVADGGDLDRLWYSLQCLLSRGVQVWPDPRIASAMRSQLALTKVVDLEVAMADIFRYSSPWEIRSGLLKTLAFNSRQLHFSDNQCWVLKLVTGTCCKHYGEKICAEGDLISVLDVSTGRDDIITFSQVCDEVVKRARRVPRKPVSFDVCGKNFIEASINIPVCGAFDSAEGVAANHIDDGCFEVIDQRFCPNAVNNQARLYMAGNELVGIVHKFASEERWYGPQEPRFKDLVETFIKFDVPQVMDSLGFAKSLNPLWWAADFLDSNPDVPVAGSLERWVLSGLCPFPSIVQCQPAACTHSGTTANLFDIPPSDRAETERISDAIARAAEDILGL